MSAAPDRIRNLAILAHINAGKTTLTERILFATGSRRFMGAVEEGTSAMDYLPEEQRRGISICAALTTVEWKGRQLNLVDTPGHVDFAAEVERTLRVVDGAVILVDGVRGVESQTEMVWRQAQRHRLPALVFVNKLDRPTAQWARAVQSLRDRLGLRVLAAAIPVLDAEGVTGLIDVVSGRATEWRAGGQPAADPAEARALLVEAAAEVDAGVFEAFALDRPVDDDALVRALGVAVRQGRVVLAYAGSALRDQGVDLLLEGIGAYLPAPGEIASVAGVDGSVRSTSASAPFAGLVFRTIHDAGEVLAVVRVYAGTVRAGDRVGVTGAGQDQVVVEVARVFADERASIPAGDAGDIVALAGLQGVADGCTVHAVGAPIRLEPVHFSTPVVTVAIEPRHPEQRVTIAAALRQLVADDPTLEERVDSERDVPLLSGMGELHLEVAAERLRARIGDSFRVGRPEVAGRTTVAAPVAAEAEWRLPEVAVAARVGLRVAPARGTGSTQVSAEPGLPPELAGEITAALRQDLAAALWTRWPLIDAVLHVETVVVSGAEGGAAVAPALEAARVAARRVFAQAALVQLEPVVEFEVECPAEALSAVLGDLRGKGADLANVEAVATWGRASGVVPLQRMLGYSTRLRSITRGLGSFFLRPAGLRPVPAEA